MPLTSQKIQVVIFYRESDYPFLKRLDFKSRNIQAELKADHLAKKYLSGDVASSLIIVYKPNDLLMINDIINKNKDLKICLVIDDADKNQALGLLDAGLYDFYIAEDNHPDKFVFQIKKWEARINSREKEIARTGKHDAELEKAFRTLKLKADQQKVELNVVIDELESFSYSVSHDLRAPLRAITGFSGLLVDEYQDKLDDEGNRYIDIIQKGTQQMSNLIDELLNFSRVGRLELRILLFDPTAIVLDIINSTKLEFERTFDVDVGHLEFIHGDAGTVRQIFSNLIRNAFKFSAKVEQPIIKIGSKKTDNGVEFFVIDNGVGFDMRYADKLFKVFQRLHTTNEFEGSGVGLAIVDRIIKKHGGKVWAESWAEGGAGFYFWLPNKNDRR